MTDLNVTIDTQDRRLAFDLFEPLGSVGPGSTVAVPGDAQLTMKDWPLRKAFGLHETFVLTLSISSTVGLGLVTNWLYDKLKGRPDTTLRIEETQVDLEQGEIKRVITRVIEEKKQ